MVIKTKKIEINFEDARVLRMAFENHLWCHCNATIKDIDEIKNIYNTALKFGVWKNVLDEVLEYFGVEIQ